MAVAAGLLAVGLMAVAVAINWTSPKPPLAVSVTLAGVAVAVGALGYAAAQGSKTAARFVPAVAAIVFVVFFALAVGFDSDPEASDTSNAIASGCIFGLLAVAAVVLPTSLLAISHWPRRETVEGPRPA